MGDGTTPEELKELGNKAFAAKRFDEAIMHYSDAIKLDKTNHVFFSNRSASYGGLGDWDKSAEDAKECIRLCPEFVKGYYRLTTALIEQKDYDAALATARQGLAIEANNPQLLKQIRATQQAQKVAAAKLASAQATRSPTTLDPAIAQELQDLRIQYTQSNRELQNIQANLSKTQREIRAGEITKSEILQVPDDAKCYRSIGKMFVMSSKNGVIDYIDGQTTSGKTKEGEMTQKLDYLERRIKSQKQNIDELLVPSTE
jgi:chaperonin cofactor prefoldin